MAKRISCHEFNARLRFQRPIFCVNARCMTGNMASVCRNLQAVTFNFITKMFVFPICIPPVSTRRYFFGCKVDRRNAFQAFSHIDHGAFQRVRQALLPTRRGKVVQVHQEPHVRNRIKTLDYESRVLLHYMY